MRDKFQRYIMWAYTPTYDSIETDAKRADPC